MGFQRNVAYLGIDVSSNETKFSISSVTPTRKYSLTRFCLACCNAHWLPGTLNFLRKKK